MLRSECYDGGERVERVLTRGHEREARPGRDSRRIPATKSQSHRDGRGQPGLERTANHRCGLHAGCAPRVRTRKLEPSLRDIMMASYGPEEGSLFSCTNASWLPSSDQVGAKPSRPPAKRVMLPSVVLINTISSDPNRAVAKASADPSGFQAAP